jgi:hypothetical protein
MKGHTYLAEIDQEKDKWRGLQGGNNKGKEDSLFE